MASLESHYGSYRLVFRFAGKKFCRSLKTENERIAKASLARLEDNLKRLEIGQIEMPPGADLVTFLLTDGRVEKRPTTANGEFATLAQLFDAFLVNLTPGSLEPTTEHCVNVHIRHFKREFGEKLLIRQLDFAAVQAYVDRRALAPGLHGKTLSATTIKKEIATLSMIWSWAQSHDYVGRSLIKKGLRYPKLADKPPFQTIAEIKRKIEFGDLEDDEIADLWDAAFLTLTEIENLLKVVKKRATHTCLYPMFVFAAHTGARRSEIRRSQLTDIDFGAGRVFLRERKRVRGRHTLRSVPISELLETEMRKWISRHPGGRHTFCLGPDVAKSQKDRHEPIPLTDDEMGHHFQQVLLGTAWEKLRGWHCLRHSFASNCAAQGIDQRMINAWMGHQTEEMVRRYRHLIPNQERSAIQVVFGSKYLSTTTAGEKTLESF